MDSTIKTPVDLNATDLSIIKTGILLLKNKLALMDGDDPDFGSIITLSGKLNKAFAKLELTRLVSKGDKS